MAARAAAEKFARFKIKMSQIRGGGYCVTFLAFQLQAYNLLDFVLGLALGVFDWYLIQVYSRNQSGENAVEIFLVIWLVGILGALLLLSSFLSFCAITNNGCRSTLIPSAYIGVVIAFVSAFLGTLIFAIKAQVFRYLEDDSSGQFTSGQIRLIEDLYVVLGISLFTLTLTQVLRFRASFEFKKEAARIDGEFEALLDSRDKAHQDEINRLKTSWEQRYSALRAYYDEKYGAGGGAGGSPAAAAGGGGGSSSSALLSPSSINSARYRDDEDEGRSYYSAPSLPIHPSVPTVLSPPPPLRSSNNKNDNNDDVESGRNQHQQFSRTSTLTSADDDTLFGPDE